MGLERGWSYSSGADFRRGSDLIQSLEKLKDSRREKMYLTEAEESKMWEVLGENAVEQVHGPNESIQCWLRSNRTIQSLTKKDGGERISEDGTE